MASTRPRFTVNTFIEIPNPDDPYDLPIYSGDVKGAFLILETGNYAGEAYFEEFIEDGLSEGDSGFDTEPVDINVVITNDGIWCAPASDLDFAIHHELDVPGKASGPLNLPNDGLLALRRQPSAVAQPSDFLGTVAEAGEQLPNGLYEGSLMLGHDEAGNTRAIDLNIVKRDDGIIFGLEDDNQFAMDHGFNTLEDKIELQRLEKIEEGGIFDHDFFDIDTGLPYDTGLPVVEDEQVVPAIEEQELPTPLPDDSASKAARAAQRWYDEHQTGESDHPQPELD